MSRKRYTMITKKRYNLLKEDLVYNIIGIAECNRNMHISSSEKQEISEEVDIFIQKLFQDMIKSVTIRPHE